MGSADVATTSRTTCARPEELSCDQLKMTMSAPCSRATSATRTPTGPERISIWTSRGK